jgi:uncharacterized repeat protein (TIGR03943 family)
MRARDVSASRIARAATLLAYSFFVSWLLQNGKISQIVHPRMSPWIELSGLLCLGLAFFQALRLDRPPRHADPPNFFVPIAFVIAMALVYVQAGPKAAGRFSGGDDSLVLESAIVSKRDRAAADASKAPLPRTLVFDDDRFYSLYNRVYDSPGEARGRRIVLRGFVDRPGGTKSDNVVLVARNLMWCCSADMAEIGFLARGPGVAGLKDGDWVQAMGTLDLIDWDMDGDGKPETVPFIEAEPIEKVDKGSTLSVVFPY